MLKLSISTVSFALCSILVFGCEKVDATKENKKADTAMPSYNSQAPAAKQEPTAPKADEHAGHNHGEPGAPDHPVSPTPVDPNRPAPKLKFKEMEFNGGAVVEGDMVVHSYDFNNEGPGELVISSVQPSCGCTAKKVAVFEDGPEGSVEKEYVMNTPIKAGQRGRVEAHLNTTGAHGVKSSKLTVHSNDPLMPTSVLQISANVEQFFKLEPPAISKPMMSRKEGGEATVKLTCLKAEDFTLKSFDGLPDWMELTLNKPDTAKKNEAEIKVRFKPGMKEGNFNHQAVLHLSIPGSEKERDLRLMVNGSAVGALQMTPNPIGIGLVPQGKPKSMKVTVQNREPEASFKVTEVVIDCPQKEFMTAEIKPEMEGQTYTIDLTINEKCPAGALRGNLKILTNHADYPETQIPFYGMVKAMK